jgi:hypothetical protein
MLGCTFTGCMNPVTARGLCTTHYMQWYRDQKKENSAAKPDRVMKACDKCGEQFDAVNRRTSVTCPACRQKTNVANVRGYQRALRLKQHDKNLQRYRDFYQENSERIKEYQRQHYVENKEMGLARSRLQRALQSGKLIRPESCEICGSVPGTSSAGRSRIVAYFHRGYGVPLDVQWICAACRGRISQKSDA